MFDRHPRVDWWVAEGLTAPPKANKSQSGGRSVCSAALWQRPWWLPSLLAALAVLPVLAVLPAREGSVVA